MVQNKIGFASAKRYGIKPDYYKDIFDGWTAVYLIGDDEYHISLNPDYYDSKFVKSISVLKQHPNGRTPIKENLKTIKEAVEVIKRIQEKYNLKEKFKYQ